MNSGAVNAGQATADEVAMADGFIGHLLQFKAADAGRNVAGRAVWHAGPALVNQRERSLAFLQRTRR